MLGKMANTKTDTEQLKDENSQLKETLNRLYDVVQGALLTLDWTIKLGMVVGVWFFPFPQQRIPQAIGFAAYALLLTIISKGLNKMKEIKRHED
jgi:hypothetical protein